MTNQNVVLAERWFEEVWNQRRIETIDELLTDESVAHSESGAIQGGRAFRDRTHSVFLSAFPDLRMTVEAMVAEGDQVAVRWAFTGTHHGDGLGLPPTGRKVSCRGVTWIRFSGGKMMEGWDCWNQGGLIESLRAPEVQQADRED